MAAPAVAWFEITGEDGPALQKFYGEMFDWKIQDAGDDSGYGLLNRTRPSSSGSTAGATLCSGPTASFQSSAHKR